MYRGAIGTFAGHVPVTCSTGGATTWTLPPAAGDHYYFVVPHNGVREGSYGLAGDGSERLPSLTACMDQKVEVCP